MAGLPGEDPKYSGGFPRERKTQKFFLSQRSRVLKKEKLSVVFMGTPEFACPSLDKLIEEEKVVAVVTQPDRPAGRGRKIRPSAVKLAASERNIPVYQPENLKDPDFLKKINLLQPDLIVVVAFGRLLPGIMLNIPRIFSINLHPSLLPKYRGPAPVPWTIIKGESQTGVTVQKMKEKVDEGEIILQRKISINPEDTCGILNKKLSYLGSQTLIEAIKLIKQGKAKLKPQQGKASYAPKITKKMGKINWRASAWEIHNLVRGLNPAPGAFTTFPREGKSCRIKIWKTAVLENFPYGEESQPGTVVKIQKETGFVVKTGGGALLIKEVQLPGKPRINAYDFIKGYRIREGFLLGG